jgi:ubiquinone/menaquinone biosynthesis C-methylase UbiE
MQENTKTTATLANMAWDEATCQWYVDLWGEHALQQAVPELIRAQIPDLPRGAALDTVLEIGCGSGAALRKLAGELCPKHAIGIDPTPRMLEIARERTTATPPDCRIDWLHACAEHLPLADASVDLALAINSLHHWHYVTAGLAEVLRVLKPGAHLLLIDDLWDELPEITPPTTGAQHVHADHEQEDYKCLDRVRTALKQAGFTAITLNFQRHADYSVSLLNCRRQVA